MGFGVYKMWNHQNQHAYAVHSANYIIGRAGFLLGALLNTRENRIGVELYLNDDKAKSYFGLLSEQKDEIENELGFLSCHATNMSKSIYLCNLKESIMQELSKGSPHRNPRPCPRSNIA
jgi:hypothetical protein